MDSLTFHLMNVVFLSQAGQTAIAASVATVIAAGIAAIAANLTQKSAADAAVKSSMLSSRTDIEKEAFDRAKEYYTDTIDRQDAELDDVRQDRREDRDRIATLEQIVRDLTGELEVCKSALRIIVPDH